MKSTSETASKLPLEPAPVWRRLAAFCYDLLLIVALAASFTALVVAVRLGAGVPPGTWWFSLSLLGLIAAFFCGFWAHGGQTLGMRAWRIRVVRDDGGALTLARAAARFVCGVVAAAPAGLGLWWSFLDERKRGWHDRWTGTRVVRAIAASGR
ncbi:MAG TPA: RDD family protein [Gammaproteobacteria bacterium]|nr:RDD family protein [Gammaproteobacteria bacterium]